MRASRSALSLLLLNHVVELRFTRRILKENYSSQRRMLCTNDRFLLNSGPGKTVLNYVPPTKKLLFNPSQKNLIVTWDIFLQDYRMISCETVDIVSVIKSTPPENFWKYFYEQLIRMSSTEKARLMNN